MPASWPELPWGPPDDHGEGVPDEYGDRSETTRLRNSVALLVVVWLILQLVAVGKAANDGPPSGFTDAGGLWGLVASGLPAGIAAGAAAWVGVRGRTRIGRGWLALSLLPWTAFAGLTTFALLSIGLGL